MLLDSSETKLMFIPYLVLASEYNTYHSPREREYAIVFVGFRSKSSGCYSME